MSLHVVILAAGKGSRMKSALPKVLHPLAGKPLLQHVLDTAQSLEAEAVHIVIGNGADQVKEAVHDANIHWALQAEQLGTGHAVAQALPNIPDDATLLVLYGDVPLISQPSLQRLLDLVEADTLALLSVDLPDATGYGRIVRDVAGDVRAIVEHKDATPEQLEITEANTGILAGPAKLIKTLLPKVENKNAQSEYYLTDLIELAVNEGFEVEAEQADNLEEVQGVNDRLQLCELECWYQSVISEQLMLSGVTLYDPNRTDVRGTLKTGIDVTIDINTVFEGNVELGDGVTVGPNCVITNSVIGAHTEIKANSLIEETSIGEHAVIGPFARLRPGTQLADKTKVGNFVETKKAIVAKGSKINHLSYIGDAELGENVNVGAGTITCNYDGVNKSKTVLGDEVFIGSNSSLVAPVTVADGATVGAGSVITKNVEVGELAVARGKQANIKGWKKPSKKT